MRDRVIKIIEQVLDEDIKTLSNSEINPENIEEWDSLTHLSIVTALEEEFNIELSIEDIPLMYKGIDDMLNVLKKYEVNEDEV